MHTDSKFFDEAYVFNPDRFTEDNQVNNVYMPFGIGPKKCIGTYRRKCKRSIFGILSARSAVFRIILNSLFSLARVSIKSADVINYLWCLYRADAINYFWHAIQL